MNQVGQDNIVNNGSRGVILHNSSFHAGVAIIKLQLAMLITQEVSKDTTAGTRASLLKWWGPRHCESFTYPSVKLYMGKCSSNYFGTEYQHHIPQVLLYLLNSFIIDLVVFCFGLFWFGF